VLKEGEEDIVARTAGLLEAEMTEVWACFCEADRGCGRHVVAAVGVVAYVGEFEFDFPEILGDAVAEEEDVIDVFTVTSSDQVL
jgi:hypothetical protein